MRRSPLLVSTACAVLLLAASATSAMAADAMPGPSPSATSSTGTATSSTGTATSSTGTATSSTGTATSSTGTATSSAGTATLTTITHAKPLPPRFTAFSYQTGTVSGLPASAAARINRFIATSVAGTVSAARKESTGPCVAGARRCGYFQLQLKAPACVRGSVCITQPGQLLKPGANTGDAWVSTATFSATTGEIQGIGAFVGDGQEADFLKAVNAGIAAQLAKGGIAPDDRLWKPAKTMQDIDAWSPTPAGIQLFFSKYDAAPGSFGVVRVLVPWLAFQ